MAWPRAACATGTGSRLAAASTSREEEEGVGGERDCEVFCWKLVEVNPWRKQNRKYEISSKFYQCFLGCRVLVYLTGPAISDDFVNPQKEAVGELIFWGMGGGSGGKAQCPIRISSEYKCSKIVLNDRSIEDTSKLGSRIIPVEKCEALNQKGLF
jgi:hypothetical protein